MGEPVPMKVVPIRVLFETPSGFAFFGFNGDYVNVENLLEIIWTYLADSTTAELAIWPLEFEKFENKSDAIGTSGIDDRITKMITNWYCSGETIPVGKSEHKLAIETDCLYCDTSWNIIPTELLQCLRMAGYPEKESIDTQGWDALKYVTAVQIMCMDEHSSNHCQMFSVEELQKINGGKGKHKGLIKDNFMVVYRRVVEVNQVKVDKLKELDVLVKQAHEKSGRVRKLQEELDKSESIAKKRKREA
ncbi:unnamed protein product [Miscanthus lutarioriparius]|uniref:Uncharacterized protein n=1 Tax=Miscanthus lutarioriparius TaxID=422564 RepID=A0A811SHC0_9POAL|nr:unnamed protein product [Miscanthus lutarioriparius]